METSFSRSRKSVKRRGLFGCLGWRCDDVVWKQNLTHAGENANARRCSSRHVLSPIEEPVAVLPRFVRASPVLQRFPAPPLASHPRSSMAPGPRQDRASSLLWARSGFIRAGLRAQFSLNGPWDQAVITIPASASSGGVTNQLGDGAITNGEWALQRNVASSARLRVENAQDRP